MTGPVDRGDEVAVLSGSGAREGAPPGAKLSPEEMHAERILLVCVLLSRAFNIGIAAAGTAAQKGRRGRGRSGLMLAAAAAEAAWLARRTWTRGAYNDRTTVWADTAFGAAMLASRRALAPRRGDDADSDDLAWMFQYSLASTAAAAMGHGPTLEGGLATAALAVAHHLGSSRGADESSGEWIAYPGTLLAVGFMGREMRRSARDLGASRRVALELGSEQATARERIRQHRLLHDSALQTLEAAVAHWEELGDAIRTRAGIEARELRQAQLGETADTDDLSTLLRGLAQQFGDLGLAVTITEAHAAEHGHPCPATTAVADAVHEALVNVRKHAGVSAAGVDTATDEDELLVVVHDKGHGFDPGRARPTRRGGFGIQGSIHGRLEEVGGSAQILSRPGTGTRVIIRCGVHSGAPTRTGALA